MTTSEVISAIIAIGGFVITICTSLVIVAFRGGSMKTRLEMVERAVQNSATKEQLAGVKEDIAEIKGMFRMTLKDGSS